ncbi:MAG: MBL fold metallo-hydrolase [Treponema sp.]|jgi:phosphoribosyl 1,2-cyclic phosphate phosphodiesterase|nr:MBL fold metallo-hydrolase [Treponema sp.]
MKVNVLGSGTSHGIPVVACFCPVCRSENPFDKRMRASIHITGEAGESIVIDTGPEFRLQAVRAGIERLDAVLLTHAHADHLHGLDDVRPLCRSVPLPVYSSDEILEEVRDRFSYVFKETQPGGGKPRLDLRKADPVIEIGSLRITSIPVKHGDLNILAWKIEEAGRPSLLYMTDTSAIPESSKSLAGKPGALIIGALRERPHETHFTFRQAMETALELAARRVWLTHICHEHSHNEIAGFCEDFIRERNLEGVGIAPAHDGLEIRL